MNNSKQQTNRFILWVLFIFGSFLSLNSSADSLKSYVDRQNIEMGDIINLTVQTDFQTLSKPDFSHLKDQFELLSQQRSSQINLINGNFESYTRWDLRLTPKQIGELIIPPFEIADVKSKPITINVKKPSQVASEYGISFFEASINQTESYVQQQLIYTLRFYHLGSLVRGNTRPPLFKGAIAKSLTKQINYQKSINGNHYEVYEWSWAIYPQQSGEMIIEPQIFNGQIRYNGRSKRINQFSKEIKLNIKPIPSSYPKQATWLPATNIKLAEDWQHNKTIRVGDSITRTIQIQAVNLLSSQLPTIELEQQIGFQNYPDQAILEDKKGNHGFISQSTRKIAIVPTADGKIHIPNYTIYWWNTEKDSLEVHQLPEKTMVIHPALISSSNANAPIQSEVKTTETTKDSPTIKTTNTDNMLWQLLSLFFAIAWIITLVLWLKQKNKPQVTNLVAKEKVALDTLDFCRSNDPKDYYQKLNHWLHRQDNELQIQQQINTELNQLQSHLFNNQPLPNTCLSQICDKLKIMNSSTLKDVSKLEANKLEKLYP